MTDSIIGRRVRRYSLMRPRRRPQGEHIVTDEGEGPGGEPVVFLSGFAGYVHRDAGESLP
jgi:hypothetical protein